MTRYALTLLALLCSAAPDDGAQSDLMRGIDAYNHGDVASALLLLQAAADQGDAEAMVNLGYIYARGHGVPPDPTRAFELYMRAAEAGDAEGMNAVGYRYNHAPVPDLNRAIHWYCRAVFGGNPRAMNNVALLFYNGQGVAPDREEARSLWRQAIARGSLNALANLGLDIASDTASSDAEREAGGAMLRDAAQRGSAYAQSVLRARGDLAPYPPPSVTDFTMVPEPHDAAPGASRLCGELIS